MNAIQIEQQRIASTSTVTLDRPAPEAEAVLSTSSGRALPKGKGRIIRDDNGNVIGVDIPNDDDEAKDGSGEPSREARETPWGSTMTEDRAVAPVVAKTSVAAGLSLLLANRSLTGTLRQLI